jgi:hypothetical protein
MKEATPVARSPAAPASAATQRRFQVRYYRRMRPQRVYPLVVEAVGQSGGRAGASTVLVRPVIPGALVTPPEAELDVSQARPQAVFHVAPLARGKLPQARVEIRSHGQLVQAINLPVTAATQCLTWWLAVLTILIPAFLITATRYHPLKGTVPREPTVRPEGAANVEPAQAAPAPKEPQKGPPAPNGEAPPMTRRNGDAVLRTLIGLVQEGGKQKEDEQPAKKPDEKDAKKEPPRETAPGDAAKKPEAKDAEKPGEPTQSAPKQGGAGMPPRRGGGGGMMGKGMPGMKGGMMGKGGMPKAGNAVAEEEPEGQRTILEERGGSPGEVLAREIRLNVPDIPDDFRKANGWCPAVTANVASALGYVYDLAVALQQDNFSFWVGVVLLGLTLMSLVSHRSVRGRRTGPPVTLPPTG